MNTGIFFEWLKAFDLYIQGSRNRKALLLIHNASCRDKMENLPSFLNIEVIFCLQKIDVYSAFGLWNNFCTKRPLPAQVNQQGLLTLTKKIKTI